MNEQELLKIINGGESSKVQFKERLPHIDSLAHELIAFANTNGGTLLIGVNDKTGVLNGLSFSEIRQSNSQIVNAASQKIFPPVHVITETVNIEEQNVIVVRIDEGNAKPNKGLGTGIRRSYSLYPDISMENKIDENQFKVIIRRPVAA